MKVIKCDVCGKELSMDEAYIITDFINYSNCIDICEECQIVYKDIESEFLQEQHEIFEQRQKDIYDLKEKYKKEILKLRKNS